MILRLKLFAGEAAAANAGNNATPVANPSKNPAATQLELFNKDGSPTFNANADNNVATNTTTTNKRLTKAQLQEQVNGLSQTNTQLQGQIKDVTRSRYEAGAYRGRQAGLIEGQRIGMEKGKEIGMKQTGVFQGLQNTWNKAGTMKKIGMGGAALAGTYFLGKGLLGGNNNNQQ